MQHDPADRVITRQINTDHDEPSVAVAQCVAEIENIDATDLDSIYECVDDVLKNLFSNPPSDEAKIKIGFNYEGYRITIDQNGLVTFLGQ